MKMAKKLSAIDAQKLVDQLAAKAAELATQASSDQREIESIALAAHTGCEKSRAKLETIRERELRRAMDLTGIDAAIKEARRNVESAEAAEAAAAQKRIAAEARLIIDRIDSLFASADKHLTLALDALKAADGRIEELHRLGFAFPTAIQVRTNALFALQTYLMALPKYWWNELSAGGVRFQAPHERRSFQQFWAQMSASLGREIAQRLGESKQKEVA
jgi:hypothetical protein